MEQVWLDGLAHTYPMPRSRAPILTLTTDCGRRGGLATSSHGSAIAWQCATVADPIVLRPLHVGAVVVPISSILTRIGRLSRPDCPLRAGDEDRHDENRGE